MDVILYADKQTHLACICECRIFGQKIEYLQTNDQTKRVSSYNFETLLINFRVAVILRNRRWEFFILKKMWSCYFVDKMLTVTFLLPRFANDKTLDLWGL